MLGILVDVNFKTGKRAVPLKRFNSVCHPNWQRVDPDGTGQELRIIPDDAEPAVTDVAGVQILRGESAINDAIIEICRCHQTRHVIASEALLLASIEQKSISVADLEGTVDDQVAALYDRGALGIIRVEGGQPVLLDQVSDRIDAMNRKPMPGPNRRAARPAGSANT